MNYLSDIKLAAERAAGQPVSHLHSIPVVETSRGDPVWQGMVEVFWTSKPPPDHVYGWAVAEQSGMQYIAVLGVSPINSPIDAVRAWIVSKTKK